MPLHHLPLTEAMHSELIYDITRHDFVDLPWLVGVGVALLLAVAAWWHQRRLNRPAGLQAFFIAMAGVATLAVGATLWDHQGLTVKMLAGQVLMAEGEVLAYSLQHKAVYNRDSKTCDRSTWESFHVGGTAFVYRRRGGSGAGFHSDREPPLPISEGMRLRLHFVEDIEGDRSQRRILRLERLFATASACM